jgi:hypothetical protein
MKMNDFLNELEMTAEANEWEQYSNDVDINEYTAAYDDYATTCEW